MSMLAERKRKTKWIINPTKKPLWITDSSGIKFGKGLMEKLGWAAGKGLGINEQGMKEPLKVSYKNDTKGMGFKGNDDDWIEQQDEFNCFLNQLRNNNESFILKGSDTENNGVKSLEEKSKWSKARVHYQKFTRGKDLSKYSENDLASILGISKAKKEISKTDEIIQEDSKISDTAETNFGVTTINSGSIEDYFKKKWIHHKKGPGTSVADNETAHNYQNENSGFSTQEEENFKLRDTKNSKEKKLKLNSGECVEMKAIVTSESNELEKSEKRKKKEKRKKNLYSEEEPEIKIRKINYDFDLPSDDLVKVDHDFVGKKKESVDVFIIKNENNDWKDKNILDFNDENQKNNFKEQKKRKKVSKKEKEEVENKDPSNIPNCNLKESRLLELTRTSNGQNSKEGNDVFEEELILKKKRKKSKIEKHFENYEIEGKVSCDVLNSTLCNQNLGIIESYLKAEFVKERDKKEKSLVKEGFECFENCNSQDKNVNPNEEIVKSTSKAGVLVVKKKKKKDKKEKLMKTDLEKEIIEDTNKIEIISEAELVGKKHKKKKKEKRTAEKKIVENTNDIEVISKLEVVKKKKMKKVKKEKSMEREEIKNLTKSGDSIDNLCVEERKSKKKRQSTPEIESVKKKNKKSKREKYLKMDNSVTQITNELEFNEKNFKVTNEGEALSEIELVKKKKKNKKEKFVEGEIELVQNCINYSIKPRSEKENFKSENAVKEVLKVVNGKKKKKNEIEEVLCDQNNECCVKLKKSNFENGEENNIENYFDKKEVKKEKKTEETSTCNEKISLNDHNRNNYQKNPYDCNTINPNFSQNILGSNNLISPANKSHFNTINCNLLIDNNVFHKHQKNTLKFLNFSYLYNKSLDFSSGKTDGENGFQNHKMELLNDKKLDKFYPGQNIQKILRLLHLCDFSKFKGSNIEKFMGYGY